MLFTFYNLLGGKFNIIFKNIHFVYFIIGLYRKMYYVVEFDDETGGGIGLIREEWLTPRKKETFWPPSKLSTQYNKSLIDGHVPDEKWKLCPIRRIFYSTG